MTDVIIMIPMTNITDNVTIIPKLNGIRISNSKKDDTQHYKYLYIYKCALPSKWYCATSTFEKLCFLSSTIQKVLSIVRAQSHSEWVIETETMTLIVSEPATEPPSLLVQLEQ